MELFGLTLGALRSWCDRKNITALYNEQLHQLAIPSPADPNHHLRVIFRPERGMVTVAMLFRFRVPAERSAAFDEALAYANASTFMGTYVHHHETGETYFRLTVPTQAVGYSDASIEWLLKLVIGSHDALEPRLKAVLAGAEPRTVVVAPPVE